MNKRTTIELILLSILIIGIFLTYLVWFKGHPIIALIIGFISVPFGIIVHSMVTEDLEKEYIFKKSVETF